MVQKREYYYGYDDTVEALLATSVVSHQLLSKITLTKFNVYWNY